MVKYLIPFSFAFFTALITVPLLGKLALKYNFVDLPNKRKVHKNPIPLLGGLAIFLSYILNLWLWFDSLILQSAITLIGALIVAVGLLDDYYKTKNKDFSPLIKIAVHFLAGLLIFSFGIRISGITSVFGEGIISFQPGLSLFITLLWVIGLMNIINFFDGLDGLASGIAIISSMTLFLISFVRGQEVIALLSVILMGTSLGFLRYNFHPAKIFMGDSGSAFLGLILAIISIEGAIKSATLLSIIMVILAFGVPIFDTVLVVFKRIKNHKPIYLADQSHAHHRLLKMGFSHKQAVATIYIISLLFSIASVIVLFLFVL